MIDGVTASLLAMGIGYGIDFTCKKFDLKGTLKADFKNAFNLALRTWSPNETSRIKLERKKHIFEDLIRTGYNSKLIENLDLETRDLLVEFDKAVSGYPALSNYIQTTILRDLRTMIENMDNLYFNPESFLNLNKYRDLTKLSLETEQPTIIYNRRFQLEESATTKEKEYNNVEIKLSEILDEKNLFFGEGGLGKSTYIKILGSLFLKEVVGFCVYFDAKKYDESSLPNLDISSDKLSNHLYTLGKCFENELKIYELDTFLLPKESLQYKKLLILDGINEIPTHKERIKILNALDIIHSKFKVTIICSSRYKDGYQYNTWKRFRSKSISTQELKRIITKHSNYDFDDLNPKNRTYLRIPFFLDKAIKYNDFIIESYSGFIEKHLLNSVKEEGQKKIILKELSKVALQAYKEKNISNIPILKIPSTLKLDDLIEKNIVYLSENGKHFKFEHQLIVDLLVSFKLSREPELWTLETFDTITFGSHSSWEIMQMILEQVESKEFGTEFLLNLYNWNYYAVLWCLKYVDQANYNKLDAIAIVLIVAEKLFDNFKHTNTTVRRYLEDLLNKFEIEGVDDGKIINRDYNDFLKLNADTFKGNSTYEDFFNEMIRTENLDFETVEKIVIEANPAKAWGYSNMFKRCKLSEENETQLKAYFLNADKLVQWRIVHTLGVAKTMHSISFLLNKIEHDEYPWVSYGALRSLIETFYYGGIEFNIAKELSKPQIISKILNNSNLSKELRNCMTYPPKDKNEIIKESFTKIIQNNSHIFEEKYGEKEEWQKAFDKFSC